MATSTKKETWIRSFNVTEPTKHEKGFTVYKVTYRAFRLDKAEEVIEVAVWKRYNDFKKLHRALSLLHYHLRRPEKFPDFAKARFFGRFDEKTIEERRQSALRLLEFTVKVPPLAKSTHFVEFFKGGETVTRRKVSSDNPILKPQVVNPTSDNGSFPNQPLSSRAMAASIPRMEGEGEENQGGASLSQSVPAQGVELGGVWLHRQQEDEEQRGEDSEGGGGEGYDDSEDERTTCSEDSMPSTPLPQLEELTFFDPLSPSEPGSTEPGTLPHSNSWLFQAMDICAELSRDSPELASNHDDALTPASSVVTSDSTDSGITVTVPPSLQSSSSDSALSSVSTSGGMTANRNSHNSLARAYLNSLRAQQAADEDANSTGITDSRSVATGDHSRHVCDDSISKWDVSGEDDYLYQAAGKISMALDNESVGNYQASFDAYKAGVAILLKGVVADKSKTRREAVRRKTAQYLMKAEDIYNKYLSVEASNARRWESEKMAMEVDPSSAHLRGNIDELKSYKVLGCIGSVLLVLDMSTYQTFIIKSLSKCCVPNTKMITRVPAYCPYMVRLYRYFETESSIFLLLEHATGGKLWNYASPYLQQQREATGKHELANSLKSSTVSRQSQRSRSGSTRSGRGLKDDVFTAAEVVTEDVSHVEDTPKDAIPGDPDAASVSSMEGKLVTSPEVSSSYVNLLDACGEYVTSGGPLGDGESIPQRLSDSNLNDLVTQSSNYDECGNNVRTDQDDSLFLSDTNEETEMFNQGDVFGSTPCKIVIPDQRETVSNVPPASMALFSIDSIDSPNEYSMGEMGDSSAFGFDSSSTIGHLVEDAVLDETGSVDLRVKPEAQKQDLDPARVIAEALAVVQEVEQMRKEEAEFILDNAISHEVPRQENMPTFSDKSNITEEIVTNKKSTPHTPYDSTVESSQAFLDTRAFGVFNEKEMVPGVDLADFFDSGSQSPKKRSQSLSEKASRHDPKDTFSGEPRPRPPFMHSASMFNTLVNEPLGKNFLSRDTKRTVSMGGESQSREGNDWKSFFDGDFTDTKGFGFDTSTESKETEIKSSDFDRKETAEQVAPDVFTLPDVPKDIPRDDDDDRIGDVFDVKEDPNMADIYMQGDNRLDTSSGDQNEVDTLGQPRQNPDGATSEEIENEMQNTDSKRGGNLSHANQKDMNLHINPLDNENQLVITNRTDSNSSMTYVSVNPSDAKLPCTGVMKDFPSSSTISAQSTPQHTFKPINSNPEIASQCRNIVTAPDVKAVLSSTPAVSTDGAYALCQSGEAMEDNIYGGENGSVGEANTTPTNSRTSTLKGEHLGMQDTSLPSLSRLFSHLDDVRRSRAENSAATLPESCVRIWASEILFALATLHAAGIICRDLNPDNILLAEGGHIRLTYFSQWKWVCQEMNLKALTNMYTAPEARSIFGVGPACDWWSYGTILFELLTGQSLYSCHPSGISSHTQLFIPDHISPEAKNLLTQLLQVNPLERLGGGQSGADEVKAHPFFKGVNWSNLLC